MCQDHYRPSRRCSDSSIGKSSKKWFTKIRDRPECAIAIYLPTRVSQRYSTRSALQVISYQTQEPRLQQHGFAMTKPWNLTFLLLNFTLSGSYHLERYLIKSMRQPDANLASPLVIFSFWKMAGCSSPCHPNRKQSSNLPGSIWPVNRPSYVLNAV